MARIWYLVLVQLLLVYVHGAPQVPCFFIFGDSISDVGNNNQLLTAAKANYFPYGVDFTGSSGRFSNGRTVNDIITELLGFDRYIQPFATARGNDILRGVNYASGASGIRDESGKQLGDNISLNRQIRNHMTTLFHLATLLGGSARNYVEKCLYSVNIGSNDYINNYFMPKYFPTSSLFTPEQYATCLIDRYSGQLQALYRLGARKIAVNGLGHIGCTPYAISSLGTNGSACVDQVNNAVQFFNERLVSLIDQLNANLFDAQFIYLNSTSMSSGDPTAAGFKVLTAGCCQVRDDGQCVPNTTPCENRNEYYFFDAIHPTEAANQFTAQRSYNALEPTDAYPYDISHLVNSQLSDNVNPTTMISSI